MSIFGGILQRFNPNKVEHTTYLSPWYFKKNEPKLGKNLIWKYVEKIKGEHVGILQLLNEDKCIGILNSNCYVKPLKGSNFLIWVRGTNKIEMYNSADLKPLDTEQIDWKNQKITYLFDATPMAELEYFIDLYQTNLKFQFPDSFKDIEEILQVNDIDGMYEDFESGFNNTAIISLKPSANLIEIFPQDWFNRDKRIDFGYQWITRAERNLKNGRIHSEGIPIDPLVLDKTNRNIQK